MAKAKPTSLRIQSIAEQSRLLAMPKPAFPLFSILRFEDIPQAYFDASVQFTTSFYTITLKKDCPCKIKYGQTEYDFDEGLMSFIGPDQVVTHYGDAWMPAKGWLLLVHPDFIRPYALGQHISEYGFFGYDFHEGLILSEKEEALIETLLLTMQQEHLLPIDVQSQDILVSQLEVLLNYCKRFYTRQFITRKTATSSLVGKVETMLMEYFESEQLAEAGQPSVAFLAEQVNMSPKYFSDTLRHLTGQSAQQHIHVRLIERAKHLLTTTELSVSEIAYQLGFEHSQSFNKVFKSKTQHSPLQFRQSFN